MRITPASVIGYLTELIASIMNACVFKIPLCLAIISSQICIAQIDLSTIDTSKWNLDTLENEKTLIITPRFEFSSDTTLYFYEKANRKIVLILEYKSTSGYMSGVFYGTTQLINTNHFIHLNSNQPDSNYLKGVADTMIISGQTTDYCIDINNLGIRDTTIRSLLRERIFHSNNNYFSICSSDNNELIPNSCLFGLGIIQRQEPPYEVYEYEMTIGFIK